MKVNIMRHELIARCALEAHAPVCRACKVATCSYLNARTRVRARARALGKWMIVISVHGVP